MFVCVQTPFISGTILKIRDTKSLVELPSRKPSPVVSKTRTKPSEFISGYKTLEKETMAISKIIGIILFFGGLALVVGGIFATRSLGDSVRTFLGMGLTKDTLWYFIGGAAAVVTSLILLLSGRS